MFDSAPEVAAPAAPKTQRRRVAAVVLAGLAFASTVRLGLTFAQEAAGETHDVFDTPVGPGVTLLSTDPTVAFTIHLQVSPTNYWRLDVQVEESGARALEPGESVEALLLVAGEFRLSEPLASDDDPFWIDGELMPWPHTSSRFQAFRISFERASSTRFTLPVTVIGTPSGVTSYSTVSGRHLVLPEIGMAVAERCIAQETCPVSLQNGPGAGDWYLPTQTEAGDSTASLYLPSDWQLGGMNPEPTVREKPQWQNSPYSGTTPEVNIDVLSAGASRRSLMRGLLAGVFFGVAASMVAAVALDLAKRLWRNGTPPSSGLLAAPTSTTPTTAAGPPVTSGRDPNHSPRKPTRHRAGSAILGAAVLAGLALSLRRRK